MSRPARSRAGRHVLLALVALLLGACGGLRAPPRVGPGVSPPDAAAQMRDDLLPVLPPLARFDAPAPPRPWLGASVDVVPAVPREGRAMAIRVVTPRVGRAPLSVEGRLGEDTPVRFGRLSDGEWLGLAPLAVGESGSRELVIRMPVAAGDTATVRRTIRVEDHRFPSTQLSVAPRYSSPPDEVLERIERERKLIAEALSVVTDNWLWNGRFTWPRPHSVTSPFGRGRPRLAGAG